MRAPGVPHYTVEKTDRTNRDLLQLLGVSSLRPPLHCREDRAEQKGKSLELIQSESRVSAASREDGRGLCWRVS
ncbi:hypothetical protein Tdes44962_MAKER07713 [Teratosphaeria destructans]|uniref:Uncharacterized protein n=1 Tax=Teratosphaeria destructans TaxID=418781 RepID=A0A9W7W5V2_9PEZI|nr:hypothetical protein Tdes44962_MAKER07713 [Teratosphaeria destructans]